MYTTNNKIAEPEFIMLPSVDFCFQELMEDENIRRGFISAILDVSPEEITSVQLLPKKLRKKHKEDKYGILDVRVRLRSGEQINLKSTFWNFPNLQSMSIRRQNSFAGRSFSAQKIGGRFKCWQRKTNTSAKHMIN